MQTDPTKRFDYKGPGGWWKTPPGSGYTLGRVGDRMVSADFGTPGGSGADGKDDIAAFYDYLNGAARIHVWRSTGSAFTGYLPAGWWGVDTGYTLGNVAGRMVAGDFDGR